AWICSALSLNDGGDHLSNFREYSRTAWSPRDWMSARMPSTVSRTCASSSALAWALMVCLTIRAMVVSGLLDRDGVQGRTHSAGDGQWGRGEQKFVYPVGGAVFGQVFDVEDFAHADAYHGNHHPVPRLGAVVGFVGTYFAAPGVGADGGDLFVVDPVGGVAGQAGGFPARVAAPVALGLAAFHMAGANDDEIAPAHLHALGFLRGFEVVHRNGLAIVERVYAQVARDIQQHAAADHFRLDLFDAVLVG